MGAGDPRGSCRPPGRSWAWLADVAGPCGTWSDLRRPRGSGPDSGKGRATGWRGGVKRVLFNLGPEFLPFVPELDIDISEPEDRKSNAETDKILSAEIGLKIPVSYLYSRYGIPEPQDGEETVGGRQDMATPGMGLTPMKQCSCGGLALKAGEEFSPGQRAIESLIAAAIEEGQAPLENIMQPFLDAVDEAESFEDLERRLLEAYPTVSTDKFRDLVERAVAMGAAVGYEDAGGRGE